MIRGPAIAWAREHAMPVARFALDHYGEVIHEIAGSPTDTGAAPTG